jgi:Sulfotransferase family
MRSGPPQFLIVGTPRSGTTLVQRLASELDGVSIPPETHFFRLFAPGLLRRQRFPLRGAELVGELRAFSELEDLQGVDLDPERTAESLGGEARTAMELFGGIVRALGGDAELYGEKTPSHLRWWRELSAANQELRFVAVVRDPRAVVASYFEAWGERPHSVIAERWAIDHRSLRAARDALGKRFLVLRYEEVVAAPDVARGALSSFLGKPRGDASAEAETPLHLPWETWKTRSSGPVTTERIEGWREVLPTTVTSEIETIAADEMRAFGYAVDGRSARLGARDQLLRYRYRLARRGERLRRRRMARRPGFA